MVAERLVLVNGKFFQRFCCAFAALFQPERIDVHRDAHAKGLALCVQPGGQLRQFFLQGGAAVGLHQQVRAVLSVFARHNGGRGAEAGGPDLADRLEEEGYDRYLA